MNGTENRFWILRLRGGPVEAGSVLVTQQDATVCECLARGLDVAPGVRIALIADGWHPAGGEAIHGALVAVQTTPRR